MFSRKAPPDAVRDLSNVPHRLALVDRQKLPVLHDDPAVDQDRIHVRAVHRIDQVGVFIIHGRQVRFVHIHNAQIRLFPHLQCTDQGIEPQHSGAVTGRHPDDGAGGHDGGIETGRFLQFGCRVHLLEHVQIVVAGAAVRPQTDDNPPFQHGGDGGHAGGQFHIALGVVDDLAAVIGKEINILLVHHDAVKCDEPLIQQADLLKEFGRPFAEFFSQLFRLRLVFQKVRRQRNMITIGQGLGRDQKFR